MLHLNTNSGKMSKSKGEFLTVSLLEEKGYDPWLTGSSASSPRKEKVPVEGAEEIERSSPSGPGRKKTKIGRKRTVSATCSRPWAWRSRTPRRGGVEADRTSHAPPSDCCRTTGPFLMVL